MEITCRPNLISKVEGLWLSLFHIDSFRRGELIWIPKKCKWDTKYVGSDSITLSPHACAASIWSNGWVQVTAFARKEVIFSLCSPFYINCSFSSCWFSFSDFRWCSSFYKLQLQFTICINHRKPSLFSLLSIIVLSFQRVHIWVGELCQHWR